MSLMFGLCLKWIQWWLSWSLFEDRLFLLADVLEKFINMCLVYYGLYPCHYFSSPGLNWGGMLRMTKIEL